MKFDLEQRTYSFAKTVRKYISSINKSLTNLDDIKQLLRSSGSIGANYIEANESMSKKDFLYKLKICRKESKETVYWLKLIDEDNLKLINEATEIMKIIGAIITRIESKTTT
jgi:four helix bundle protein